MSKCRPNPRSLDKLLMDYTTNLLKKDDSTLILSELPYLFDCAKQLRDTLHLAMPKTIIPTLTTRYSTIVANINTLAESVNYPERLPQS